MSKHRFSVSLLQQAEQHQKQTKLTIFIVLFILKIKIKQLSYMNFIRFLIQLHPCFFLKVSITLLSEFEGIKFHLERIECDKTHNQMIIGELGARELFTSNHLLIRFYQYSEQGVLPFGIIRDICQLQ